MNRRIKKKLQKRLWYKRYAEFRIMRFFELVRDRPNDRLLYIVTGKKSKNNKAIHSVSLLTDVKPISSLSIMNDAENKTENKTFTLEFTCNQDYMREKIDNIALELLSKPPR